MKVWWTEIASQDWSEIVDYIALDDVEAAISVGERIQAQVDMLADFPEMGRTGRTSGTRELVVPHTPYVVAYCLQDDVVCVLRVLHGALQWPEGF